jgi:diguanylate cyclase (GGDEF)-like protein
MSTIGRGRVLIVDDDATLRTTLAGMLERHGHDVCEAMDGRAALRAISNNSVDVVLLDLSMPGSGGADVLRNLHLFAAPPTVIIVSGENALESRLSSLYGGAADYLTKPLAIRQRQDLMTARTAALVDPMTGLGNRALFDEVLAREIKRSIRQKRPMALVYFDADGLKAVNDVHGHATGDQFLCAFARTLKAACRAMDAAARIGGDEFAAILPETSRKGAEDFMQRFKSALAAEKIETDSKGDLRIAASAGLAILGEDAVDAEGMRLAADRELYRDKEHRELPQKSLRHVH